MDYPPPTASPEDLADAAQAAELQGMLVELARIGMNLARLVEQHAQRQAAAAPPPDPAAPEPAALTSGIGPADLAFSRIARAVQQSITLATKLAEDRRTRNRAAAEAAPGTARGHPAHPHQAEVRRLLEQSIKSEPDPDRREDRLSWMDRRLNDSDVEAAFANRSISYIVDALCQQLGVVPDYSGWTDTDPDPP